MSTTLVQVGVQTLLGTQPSAGPVNCITVTVADIVSDIQRLIAGWSIGSLEALIGDALTIQSECQAGTQQELHTEGQALNEPFALLPPAATTLARMLDTYFSMHSASATQHSSQQGHHQAPSAARLRTLLSLTALVGSLSCSVSSEHGRHPPNLSPGKAADEQSEQGHKKTSPVASASEHASEAEARVQTPGLGNSEPGQPGQEGELQGSTGSQGSPQASDVQQMPLGAAKQCQEICLLVGLIGNAVFLTALQLQALYTHSMLPSGWLWQSAAMSSYSNWGPRTLQQT